MLTVCHKQQPSKVSLPPDVFAHILGYCDTRLEDNQRTLLSQSLAQIKYLRVLYDCDVFQHIDLQFLFLCVPIDWDTYPYRKIHNLEIYRDVQDTSDEQDALMAQHPDWDDVCDALNDSSLWEQAPMSEQEYLEKFPYAY